MARRQERARPDDTIWRGNILYFKKRWPVEVARLDPSLGQFLERSLKTADYNLATSRCATYRVEFDRTCQETLAGGVVAPKTGNAVQDWLNSLNQYQRAAFLAMVNERTAERDGPAPDAEEALIRLNYENFQAEWLAQKGKPILPAVADAVLGPVEKARLEAQMQALLDAALARSAGVTASELLKLGYPVEELSPSVRNSAEVLAELSKKKTLSDGLALRTQGMENGRYRSQMEWALRLFHGIVGEKPLIELKRDDLTTFETALRRMPSGRAMVNVIKQGKMTVQEVLSATKSETKVLDPKTIAKHVEFICSIADTAFGKGLAGDKQDPFVNFKRTRLKRENVRRHFLPSEIDALFSRVKTDWLPASPDWAWITLIGLFHGARREEICQLLKSDVREIDGISCLNISTEVDEEADADDIEIAKRLKTVNATRVIPIHQKLLDAGFLKYVQASKGPRVFASLTADADGRFGGTFGKRFGELKRKAAIKGGRALVFHSLRHTAIGAMRAAEWPYSVQLAISGHANGGSINDAYGAATSPKVTKPWVDKLSFPVPALEAVLAKLRPLED